MVPMAQSDEGRIYYVLSCNGSCCIKEIIPTNDFDHFSVFESKSDICLGFKIIADKFYFLDENKTII